MTYQPHHGEDVSLKTGNEGTAPAAVPADHCAVMLKQIAEHMTVMMGSAKPLFDGDQVSGYTIRTGALHKIIGLLSGSGYSVVIPAVRWCGQPCHGMGGAHRCGDGRCTAKHCAALATSAPPPPAGMPASDYLAKVEANPRRAAALQRARERATSAPPPLEAGEPSGIRYTSWCDKHSRATPCDRCAGAGPKELTEAREPTGVVDEPSSDGLDEAAFLERMEHNVDIRNASAELSDERIDTLAKPFAGLGGVENYRAFALAVLAARPSQLSDALVQIGWRWAYRPDSPPGHQHSKIFTDDKPGPPAHALAAANNSSFGPVTVQKVYVLQGPN